MTARNRLLSKFIINPLTGCWEYTGGLNPGGYGNFWLDGRTQQAHRVAYMLLRGNVPDGLCVCHTCDNRRCINPDHLFVGTHLDNANDRESKGRTAKGARNGKYTKPEKTVRGERHGNARFTDEFVRRLRKEYTGEYGQASRMSRMHGIPRSTLEHILKCDYWKHV